MTLFSVSLNWLPVSGIVSLEYEHLSPLWKAMDLARHLTLPVLISAFGGLASISRYMKSSMLEVLAQDYIRTAYAKGLSENKVLYKHAFRNSLLPVIPLFVNIFPAAVGGSVIVETIFSYPGMGFGSYEAIHNYDYPVIVAVFSLAGIMTMFAYLLADILYSLVDPRISFHKKI
jgi:peptide/nickel transport system permease protein